MTIQQPPYSPVREAGPTLYVSGQLGWDEGQVFGDGIAAQTTLALINLEALLLPFGAGRADIVKTTVFLADLALWAEMNEPYRAFFGDILPARSAVGVSLPAGALVEIEAVVLRPS